MVFWCGNPDQAGSTSCSNEYTCPALKIGWIGRVIPGIPANQYSDWKSSGYDVARSPPFESPVRAVPGPRLCLIIDPGLYSWSYTKI
jgi:hypothetical protein